MMTDREPIETRNLDIYGDATLPWSRPRGILDAIDPSAMITWFLGTTGSSGRPHAAGVGAMWVDGDLYFTSSDTTKKSKDLSANPFASIAVSLDGIDLVFEGEVERVTDRSTLETVIKKYADGGWPATVDGDAVTAPFSAPSAGPPPWKLYRLAFERVIGVASAEPNGATTWRFA
jgi:Pyridoxamine 5'-phosphate oxidase